MGIFQWAGVDINNPGQKSSFSTSVPMDIKSIAPGEGAAKGQNSSGIFGGCRRTNKGGGGVGALARYGGRGWAVVVPVSSQSVAHHIDRPTKAARFSRRAHYNHSVQADMTTPK